MPIKCRFSIHNLDINLGLHSTEYHAKLLGKIFKLGNISPFAIHHSPADSEDYTWQPGSPFNTAEFRNETERRLRMTRPFELATSAGLPRY